MVRRAGARAARPGDRAWRSPTQHSADGSFSVLKSLMIPRYTRPEMGRIWSDQNKFQQWLEVELAASEALAELGVVPAEAARLLRAHAGFDVARILEIEKEVKHDVIAFTTAVAETMARAGHAEASRWLHYGLTSNDVVDTAQALLLQQASAILLARSGGAARRAEAPRAGIPAHRADRPHARRARRAHHVRPEARHLVRGSGPQPGAAAARRRKICAWARFRARWARSRTSARKWRSGSARGWT